MDILDYLKKKSIKRSIILMIFFALFTVPGVMILMEKPEAPLELTGVSYEDVGNETGVSIAHFYPISGFATEEEDGHTYHYYTIAVVDPNEELYLMGLRTTQERSEELAPLFETDEMVEAGFPAFGNICTLSGDARTYFEEMLVEQQIPADIPVAYYYLADNGYTPQSEHTTTLIMGAFLIAMGLFMAYFPIKALTGGFQKRITAAAAVAGNPQQFLLELGEFYEHTTPIHGVRMDQSHLFFQSGMESVLIDPQNLAWVYIKQTRHRVYFIPVFSSYRVIFCTNDKKAHSLNVRSEKDAQELLSHMMAIYPDIAVGYNKQLESLYKKDPAALKQAAREARSQQDAQA